MGGCEWVHTNLLTIWRKKYCATLWDDLWSQPLPVVQAQWYLYDNDKEKDNDNDNDNDNKIPGERQQTNSHIMLDVIRLNKRLPYNNDHTDLLMILFKV